MRLQNNFISHCAFGDGGKSIGKIGKIGKL